MNTHLSNSQQKIRRTFEVVLQKSNQHPKLFEIEEDTSIIEIFTHLKALYEEQWGDAEATAPPESPGEISMEEDNETDYAQQTNIEEKVEA